MAKAQGDFSQSNYLLNSSINGSDNRQTYVFDKTTKHNDNPNKIWILDGGI